MTDTPPALEVRDLDVRYGAVQILFGTTLNVASGESLALLGTNGAGKSTLLRAISGLTPISGGSVRLHGDDLAGQEAERRVTRGVVLVQGGNAVFRALSVRDNLRAGCFTLGRDGAVGRERMDEVLDVMPALKPMLSRRAGLLSGGEQQMLAIAKALLLRPRVLMIDELSLGLAPVIVGHLIEVVQQLRLAGTTIVIVEQSLNVALHLAERAVFMEKGEIRFEGRARDLLERDDVARAVFMGGQK